LDWKTCDAQSSASLRIRAVSEIHAFRASCTSADSPDLHFEYFVTEPEALEWSEDAVAQEDYFQIVVEAQRADGPWETIASFVSLPPPA
jgi:hypothetical protein